MQSFHTSRVKARIIANAISELRTNNQISLIGQHLDTARELAILSQAYRDPRAETMRYIFVRRERIVQQAAFTSGLPASSVVFDKPGYAALGKWIRRQIESTRSDGFWALHNHPSGKTMPSDEDKTVTKRLARISERFKGQVIINCSQYTVISPRGSYRTFQLESQADKFLVPSRPHPALGKRIKTGHDIAQIVASTKVKASCVLVIARCADGTNRGLMEIALSTIEDRHGYLLVAATLRRFALSTGSADLAITIRTDQVAELRPHIDLIRKGIERDLILDVFVVDRSVKSIRELLIPDATPDRKRYGLGLPITARRVQERPMRSAMMNFVNRPKSAGDSESETG